MIKKTPNSPENRQKTEHSSRGTGRRREYRAQWEQAEDRNTAHREQAEDRHTACREQAEDRNTAHGEQAEDRHTARGEQAEDRNTADREQAESGTRLAGNRQNQAHSAHRRKGCREAGEAVGSGLGNGH